MNKPNRDLFITLSFCALMFLTMVCLASCTVHVHFHYHSPPKHQTPEQQQLDSVIDELHEDLGNGGI